MYAYFVDYVSRLPYSYNLKNALLVFIKTFSAFIVKQVNIDAIFN